jgi:hypothetical protein
MTREEREERRVLLKAARLNARWRNPCIHFDFWGDSIGAQWWRIAKDIPTDVCRYFRVTDFAASLAESAAYACSDGPEVSR